MEMVVWESVGRNGVCLSTENCQKGAKEFAPMITAKYIVLTVGIVI